MKKEPNWYPHSRTNVTDDERNKVYAAIRARKERLTRTRGHAPSGTRHTPDGRAEFRLLTADRGSE